MLKRNLELDKEVLTGDLTHAFDAGAPSFGCYNSIEFCTFFNCYSVYGCSNGTCTCNSTDIACGHEEE